MVFEAKQKQNETYTFKDMLCQDDCQKFIDAIMVEVNAQEERYQWTQ